MLLEEKQGLAAIIGKNVFTNLSRVLTFPELYEDADGKLVSRACSHQEILRLHNLFRKMDRVYMGIQKITALQEWISHPRQSNIYKTQFLPYKGNESIIFSPTECSIITDTMCGIKEFEWYKKSLAASKPDLVELFNNKFFNNFIRNTKARKKCLIFLNDKMQKLMASANGWSFEEILKCYAITIRDIDPEATERAFNAQYEETFPKVYAWDIKNHPGSVAAIYAARFLIDPQLILDMAQAKNDYNMIVSVTFREKLATMAPTDKTIDEPRFRFIKKVANSIVADALKFAE